NNHGDCTWAAGSLRLRYHHSDPALPRGDLPDVVVDQDVAPSGTFTFRAPFHAPGAPGHYRIHWELQDRAGHALKVSSSRTIWADIVVRPREQAAVPLNR
ncbi:MAG TPA: NBR1-Ig-like domain-containing protein, partial [Longimicrobiaceae bacterium]